MLNTITIMGRFVRDPELHNAGQHRVCNFTLAVDRDYGGDDRETDFIDCVAWNAQAEFISKYFSKGRMAVVTGKLESSNWEDDDGNKRTSWRINADRVYFGDSKKEDQKENPPKKSYNRR